MNMLYPRESKTSKVLVYACNKCDFEAPAASPVVFRHEVIKSERNQLEKVPDGIITDPTLGRENIECPKCKSRGAVFVMPKIGTSDDRIKLIFVCTNAACIYKWQA
jgi:DNA-directed RNA polymerase II subunit RPB9